MDPRNKPVASLSVPPEYGMLGTLRQFVSEQGKQLGLSDQELDSLSLAVDEAATNIIEHAVRGMPHEITCTCTLDDQDGTVLCKLDYDAPRAFEPEDTPKKEAILSRVRSLKPGGLGVYLVHTLVDHVEYGRSGGRNVIVLRMHSENR